MKSNIYDCLKYWRVIRQYVKVKYNISQGDLDMLLFLYSEGYFGKDKFREFESLTSWEVNRFDRMLRDGWIENFRQRKGRNKGIYALSFKAKRMITSIYKKLSGEEIPMTGENNPMFRKNVKFTDKVYRNMIQRMNAEIREERTKSRQQHHALE